MKGLSFDADQHLFFYEGKEVPSVTHILRDLGFIRSQYFSQAAMDRGSAVHLAAQYLDEGRLDEGSLDPRIVPYLDAYRQWREESGAVIVKIEETVYNRVYGYAGIVDRVFTLKGVRYAMDIKTGQEASWHRLQVEAYAQALPYHPKTCLLYLNPGKYKFVTTQEDPDEWRACMRVYYRRRR